MIDFEQMNECKIDICELSIGSIVRNSLDDMVVEIARIDNEFFSFEWNGILVERPVEFIKGVVLTKDILKQLGFKHNKVKLCDEDKYTMGWSSGFNFHLIKERDYESLGYQFYFNYLNKCYKHIAHLHQLQSLSNFVITKEDLNFKKLLNKC